MYHRVCSLIEHLNYNNLMKQKILPQEKFFTYKTVQSLGGNSICPLLAKELGASEYGFFMEKIIECLLNNQCQIESLLTIKNELNKNLQSLFNINAYQSLADLLKNNFLNNNILLQPQVELTDEMTSIQGHPDLMSFDVIYDIKTTGRFGKMRTYCILQLLSYYCLAKIKKLPITSIGLILPFQLTIISYNLNDWDWDLFYKSLITCINENKLKQQLWSQQPTLFCLLYKQHVGVHCHKNDLINFLPFYSSLQFFINGNITSKITYTSQFLIQLKENIKKYKNSVFIHSPYCLNLCHPNKNINNKKNNDEWTFYCIKQLLEFGYETGIKGIVVHCGKTCGNNYDTSLLNMRDSIIRCSEWATTECKLLIENCSGQQGETLLNPDELSLYYNLLPNFVKDVTGIVVDTCHAFSAGFNPMDYILTLQKNNVPILLIHFNDSKVKKGSKLDRHAKIGTGYIGQDILNQVLIWAINNNIPMVTE